MDRSPKAHLMRILDSTGDTQLSYDPSDETAVREIEERFNALMERSFIAFDVSTQPGKIITKFDPDASEIIVSHRFVGG
jgi:hypothetical protein